MKLYPQVRVILNIYVDMYPSTAFKSSHKLLMTQFDTLHSKCYMFVTCRRNLTKLPTLNIKRGANEYLI